VEGEWRDRKFGGPLEVADEDDGRVVFGRAVPYGEVTEVMEGGIRFTEEFEFGTFARTLSGPPGRVKFYLEHDELIGVARRLEDRQDGLWAWMRMSNGPRGDELLEKVRDGTLDSLSVRFRGLQPRRIEQGQHVSWREAQLREISLCPWGQYAGAQVAGVRSNGDSMPNLAEARRLLEPFGIKI
jgi:HK97 family phage prohead protease